MVPGLRREDKKKRMARGARPGTLPLLQLISRCKWFPACAGKTKRKEWQGARDPESNPHFVP
jgi:hypothetical protein